MRITFGKNITKLAKKDKKIVVLTGDLGHGVFEDLAESVGPRFINAGVAEHNMVTVAAGLAYAGMKSWIYSVAPFVTIKVLEEIRNDIAYHSRNVKIVGLGGGFDYAMAGPTHHILSDVSMILALQNFKVYIPGFSEDVTEIMKKMHKEKNPGYLRLTKAEKTDFKIPRFAPVRRIVKGTKVTVVVLGSMINRVLPSVLNLSGIDYSSSEASAKSRRNSSRQARTINSVDVWLISEMPFEFPKELIYSIKKTKKLVIIEEHVKMGALGSFVNEFLIGQRIEVKEYSHLYAKGYTSHRYGSRDFYLKENGLDAKTIRKTIQFFL